MRANVLAAQATERDGPVGPAWLSEATAWLAEVAPDWEALTGRVPRERRWLALVDEPDLQGWLICWPPGQARGLHGHDGAAGAFQVLRGSLRERFADHAGEPLAARCLKAGMCTSFSPAFVHAVHNTGQELVTSVHLYGRAVPVAGAVGAAVPPAPSAVPPVLSAVPPAVSAEPVAV
jgi:predicted metal-dependent enzyme (double-stranded beta helix superfamily)